jgi:hypothetical protein
MTLATAKKECATLGYTLVKDRDWGQYIVKPQGARSDDPRAYFTDDIGDAVGTARAMARQELITYASGLADDSLLDDMVHDAAQSEHAGDLQILKDFDDQEDHISDAERYASDVNNGGYEDQIDYLLAQGATLGEIRATLNAYEPGDAVEVNRTGEWERATYRGRLTEQTAIRAGDRPHLVLITGESFRFPEDRIRRPAR